MPTKPDAHPANYSEAVRYLHSPRTSRTVYLTSDCHKRNAPTPSLDVTGPTTPGSLLTVHVLSGLPRLRVLSGNVHVILASSWGNSLTVLPAAAQTTGVYVRTSCKASVYGADSVLVLGDLSRAFLSPYRAPVPEIPVSASCPF